MNDFKVIGNLTKDIEIRKTQGGKSFSKFNLAVKRKFKTNGVYETDFLQIQIWGNDADNLARFCGKGSMIAVTGRIQVSSYDDASTGKKKFSTDLVAENVEYLVSKKQQSDDSFDSFNQEQPNDFDHEFSTDNTLDIDSDSLPF